MSQSRNILYLYNNNNTTNKPNSSTTKTPNSSTTDKPTNSTRTTNKPTSSTTHINTKPTILLIIYNTLLSRLTGIQP